SDLTSSRIHNYKKMQRRRIVFQVRVIYQTPFDQLKEIPRLMESIIKEHKPVTFGRAHFFAFEVSSLSYEMVYHVESGDYDLYMDIQQSINLMILEQFENKGIYLAYPTRKVFFSKKGEKKNEHETHPALLLDKNDPAQKTTS